MMSLSTFQRNNLLVGTKLAAELSPFLPDRMAFVVVGSYVQTLRGAARPPKTLNVDQPNLRFWIRKYEIDRSYLESDLDITDYNLVDSMYLNDIQTVEELENELRKYIQDFSLLEVSWKVKNPL